MSPVRTQQKPMRGVIARVTDSGAVRRFIAVDATGAYVVTDAQGIVLDTAHPGAADRLGDPSLARFAAKWMRDWA